MKNLLIFLLTTLVSISVQSQEKSFQDWLEELREEARSMGISDHALSSLDGIELNERVLKADRNQAEFVQTFSHYIGLRITPGQIALGRKLIDEHSVLLNEIQRKYGLPPHYLVSFWAMESNYGRNTGGHSVIRALATLAYDPRRAEMFRRELLIALQIIDAGHISAEQMSGSWAGAMGQLQFLPSNFMQYGIDGDGDGRIDIWNSLPDVFHSAANFISSSGWKYGEKWGREVSLPENFDFSLSGLETRKHLQEWHSLGITQISGAPLPVADMEASVILPSGAKGPAFLVYENYRVALQYNSPMFYGLSVGHMADRLAGGAAIQGLLKNEKRLSTDEVRELQQRLTRIGFDSGNPDGKVGKQTRNAIRGFQKQINQPVDGHASHELLEVLRDYPDQDPLPG